MPRARSQSRENLLDNALNIFWKTGYHVVSIGDIVRETGVSRAGIYADLGGKEELFHTCLERYHQMVVTPAIAPVEASGAGVGRVEAYPSNLLTRYEASDGFGRRCLVGNTLALFPLDAVEMRAKLQAHFDRLTDGLYQTLTHENGSYGLVTPPEMKNLARSTISVQGLWSYLRLTADVTALRAYFDTLIAVLRSRLRGTLQ